MFSSKGKASSSRRLSADVHTPLHTNTSDQQHIPGASTPAPLSAQTAPNTTITHNDRQNRIAVTSATRTAACTGPPAVSRPTSKAQALAAFRSLVEGAARVLPQPNPTDIHYSTPELHSTGTQKEDARQQDQQQHGSTAGATHVPPPVVDAQQQRLIKRTNIPRPRTASVSSGSPDQLLSRASGALQKLLQQLQQRSLTYLYQFDGLLQAARDALAALVHHLTGSTARAVHPAATLQQLLAREQLQQQSRGAASMGTAAAAAVDAVLAICTACWVSRGSACLPIAAMDTC